MLQRVSPRNFITPCELIAMVGFILDWPNSNRKA